MTILAVFLIIGHVATTHAQQTHAQQSKSQTPWYDADKWNRAADAMWTQAQDWHKGGGWHKTADAVWIQAQDWHKGGGWQTAANAVWNQAQALQKTAIATVWNSEPNGRNGRLTVSPTPLPTPPSRSMSRDEYYNAKIWPTPTPVPEGQKPVVGWMDPEPGTRWIAPPEIQTWNPYLRGEPDELVDFYEGYTFLDTMARMQAPGFANCLCSVKRRDTPMWRAAELLSVELPSRDNLESDALKDSRWEHFAKRATKMGMDIPLKDPRVYPTDDPRWQDVPSSIDNRVLRHQLYHALRYPLDYGRYDGRAWPPETGGSMKGRAPRPQVWTRPASSSSS